jgi:hypothetical protein
MAGIRATVEMTAADTNVVVRFLVAGDTLDGLGGTAGR